MQRVLVLHWNVFEGAEKIAENRVRELDIGREEQSRGRDRLKVYEQEEKSEGDGSRETEA